MDPVEVGFFSFSEITDPAEHRSYNEWHQLDHLPEQLPLPGIAFGGRWVSTPACRAARTVDEELLRAAHYVTLYLMTAPVAPTLERFRSHGERLRVLGRFHRHRRSLLSDPFRFLGAAAATRVLVSAAALPWRPARGVHVVVEDVDVDAGAAYDEWACWVDAEHVPAVLAVPGVAGVWAFGGRGRRLTVHWLDGDPLAASAALAPVLAERWSSSAARPSFAGPFETITPWRWDWFDEPASPPR